MQTAFPGGFAPLFDVLGSVVLGSAASFVAMLGIMRGRDGNGTGQAHNGYPFPCISTESVKDTSYTDMFFIFILCLVCMPSNVGVIVV